MVLIYPLMSFRIFFQNIQTQPTRTVKAFMKILLLVVHFPCIATALNFVLVC